MFSLSYSFFCLSICFALWNTTCEKSSDVSATMCDVMFSENTIVDKKACSIQMMCAYRGQTVCCTTELWLSVDKREKDNKQRRNDVSVQCLCNAHSVTC